MNRSDSPLKINNDRFSGCLIGLTVGDAVGTTVEFKPRDTFAPVTDMAGGGPFGLKPGEWTDDTSMALCLAESLAEKQGFDAKDQMKRYCRWKDEGYLSSTGECFDIGNTVCDALERFQKDGDPFAGLTDPDSHTSGNGSIMRLAPIPMFFFPDREAIWRYSAESSRTTHGVPECLDACRLLGDMIYLALSGADKKTVISGTDPALIESPKIRAIAQGEYLEKSRDDLAMKSGYVVTCLENALWCFWHTASFRDAIAAANLGDDAGTVGAVCGQIAGAYYGEKGIPGEWVERVVGVGGAVGNEGFEGHFESYT